MRAIASLILLLIFMDCSPAKKPVDNGWDVIIKGKVKFPQQPGVISIQELRNDGSAMQRVVVELDKKDNSYSATIHLTEPGIYKLDFYGTQRVNLMVDHSPIEVNVDGNNPQGAVEIKGSPDHDLYTKVISMFSNSPEMKNLNDEFQKAASAKDEKKIKQLQDAYVIESGKLQKQVSAFLQQQPPSLAVLNLIQNQNLFDKDKNLDLFENALTKLQKSWPTYHLTKEFADLVAKMKITAIGQVAPEIALPNPEGQVVKLSSLRGKYVLIDFWAKWCGPCRGENPNVVRAYHKFKAKGFEVYSVSLDRTKEDWVQAIKEDGLDWTHVSDLKYFDCAAAKTYNINSIPFSILLDKDGVIVDKNLRGNALDKKLTEILGK